MNHPPLPARTRLVRRTFAIAGALAFLGLAIAACGDATKFLNAASSGSTSGKPCIMCDGTVCCSDIVGDLVCCDGLSACDPDPGCSPPPDCEDCSGVCCEDTAGANCCSDTPCDDSCTSPSCNDCTGVCCSDASDCCSDTPCDDSACGSTCTCSDCCSNGDCPDGCCDSSC